MARDSIKTSLLLLVVAVCVQAQFYDYYQDFHPFAGFYGNNRHDNIYEITTKRPKTTTTTTTKRPQFIWNFDGTDKETSKEKQHKRKLTTQSSVFNFNFFPTTTVAPTRKTTKTSNRNRGNTYTSQEYSRPTKPKTNSKITNNYNNPSIYPQNNYADTDGKIYFEDDLNNIGDSYTTNPIKTKPYEQNRPVYNHYGTNEETHRIINNGNTYTTRNPSNPIEVPYEENRPVFNNYGSNEETHRIINNENTHTTRNPYGRPGVKPVIIQNGPPITNRPTYGTGYPTHVRPSVDGQGEPPELLKGVDEDDLSYAEKARYIDLAERMCDKYKKLNTKKVQAIPLLPSPEPVEVNVADCAPITIPLVVGGKVVTIREFPHMALLGWIKLEGDGYSWKCGGSLVSEQYVLTAAHCAYEERDNTVITGSPRVVQLGSSYMDDPNALIVKVSAVVRHPKYKAPKSYHDIALVQLSTPVTFSDVVRPACLGVPPSTGEPVIATGWGQTKFGGNQSLELRSVSIPIWDQYKCAEALGTSRKFPNGPEIDNQVCAGDPHGGKDTCQGDSGGPAQIQDGCVWRVVAVTSVGRSCGAPKTPGLYAIAQRIFISATVFGQKTTNYNTNNNQANNNQVRNNNNNFRVATLDRTDSNEQENNNRNTNQQNYGNYQSNNNQYNNNNSYQNENSNQQNNYGTQNQGSNERQYDYGSEQQSGYSSYGSNNGQNSDSQNYNSPSSVSWWK